MQKKIYLIPILLLTVFITPGCGKKTSTEDQLEKNSLNKWGDVTQVDLNDEGVEMKKGDASFSMGSNMKLPEGFPEDVYVIEGNILSASKASEQYQVYIQTESQEVEEIKYLYEEKLKENSWKIESSLIMSGSANIQASKNGKLVSVSISSGQDVGAVVMLTVMEDYRN